MKLTVPEAAALLGSTQERVHDWIEEMGLPAQRIRGQYRINRAELLEWATSNDITLKPRVYIAADDTEKMPTLADALRSGGIHFNVASGGLEAALRNILALLPLADDADRDMLLHILIAREDLGVVGIGDGIAIPNVRTPIVLASAESIAALAFFTEPLPLKAPDEQPVDTLFLLLCPTVHAHLAMLAKLAFCLRVPTFRETLRRRAPEAEILRMAAEVEER
jgi:nitrogen PTS system EIIA component